MIIQKKHIPAEMVFAFSNNQSGISGWYIMFLIGDLSYHIWNAEIGIYDNNHLSFLRNINSEWKKYKCSPQNPAKKLVKPSAGYGDPDLRYLHLCKMK